MRGAISIFAILALTGCGVPSFAPRSDRDVAVKDFRDEVDYLKHEQSNFNSELRILDGRIGTQDGVLDSLKRELVHSQQDNRQQVANNIHGFGQRLASVEGEQKALAEDMRKLRNHTTQINEAVAQSKRKLNQFEQSIQSQTENMKTLEGAIRALTSLVKGDASTPSRMYVSQSHKGYEVRAGDTLEKIAMRHHVSILELKKANQLKGDLIMIGQKLLIPIQ
jgi:LysM repeat protein